MTEDNENKITNLYQHILNSQANKGVVPPEIFKTHWGALQWLLGKNPLYIVYKVLLSKTLLFITLSEQ